MVYLEINKKNYNNGINGRPCLIDKLNNQLDKKNSKTFILFYMEGCGPCNATRPEWSKLQNVLSNDILNNDEIAIVAIDQELTNKLKNIKSEPNSFPTMRFITNTGNIFENYEDSNILKKDRTIDSFVEWIESKIKSDNFINKKLKKYYIKGGKKTRKKYACKWSLKYKRSINCRKPKGFSQKQYCRKNK